MSTLLAEAWSFAGLRRKRDFDQDVTGLDPIHAVLAALLGVALLIATLLGCVALGDELAAPGRRQLRRPHARLRAS